MTLDPNAAAGTAGDPVESGAEHDPGEQGHEQQQPTVEELQAQLAEMQRREELLLRAASRGGGPAAAVAPASPPTAPDPRAEAAMRENDAEEEALRAEVQRLATAGDATSKMALREAKARLRDIQRFGEAMRYLHAEIQEIKATSSVPEQDRDGWKAWYAEHRSDYNSIEAARLAYDGHKARESASNPKPPAGNGSGGKPPVAPRTPVKQRVDLSGVSLRPMGAAETRGAVEKVQGAEFDARIEELQRGTAADRAEARRLQGLLLSGDLELID